MLDFHLYDNRKKVMKSDSSYYDHTSSYESNGCLKILIDLSCLEPLNVTHLKDIESFPLNALLLGTDHGYYVTSILYEKLKISSVELIGSLSQRIGDTNIDEDLKELDLATHMKIETSMNNIEILRMQANDALATLKVNNVIQMNKHHKMSVLEKVR